MCMVCFFFFFNDTATTEIYTLSLHDALPIYRRERDEDEEGAAPAESVGQPAAGVLVDGVEEVLRRAEQPDDPGSRSEEHTSELQSRQYLVCRLLLEKKKNISNPQSLLLSKQE